ncbi:hypothetical protein [Paeniglutamicibacter cryotolerans]|uniref:Tetratricopeptide (TPR) repeat protein n=1 Tax=Paeniglutamicibacter cryotolerans TaxID=670079 RepID=A0A839QJA5_9MICC|nr:hypothetical protein [Paeniglutamicibacter cryotolerans]MBB2996269.1 tetratricopeptide (TPR) repeat protein [Paeniglutamicibacter cryotolerans]
MIDDDVTGKELDRITRAELRYLDEKNNEWVSKHLVMAGRLIDYDPELAYDHALAASRRGGRVAVVREAVGLTAYAAGEYADALREFRTHRRISGSNMHLPVIADCERGLGRSEKALETAHGEDAQTLDTAGKVEMAIVASGAQVDLGNLEAAVTELEIPQLDLNRAFSFSPRLFTAYANALEAVGRDQEALIWRDQITVAESALGVGEFEEPEIIDFGEDDEEPARKPRARDFVPAEPAPATDSEEAAAGDVVENGSVEDDKLESVVAGESADAEENPEIDEAEDFSAADVEFGDGASPEIDAEEER